MARSLVIGLILCLGLICIGAVVCVEMTRMSPPAAVTLSPTDTMPAGDASLQDEKKPDEKESQDPEKKPAATGFGGPSFAPSWREGDKPPEDKRFIATSIAEPEMATTADDAKKAGYIAIKGGGYIFERKNSSGKKVSGVVVPATILINRGLVELFGCGEGGKAYESILKMDCDVHSLDLALGLADFKRGKLPEKLGEPDVAAGTRAVILVQWKDKSNKVVTYRSEDLIIHTKLESFMPRVGWAYVGAWYEVEDPNATASDKKTYKILSAASTQSLITTMRDPSTLFDNPLPDATDNTRYAANWMALPAPGTKAILIIRAPDEAEAKEISKAEKDFPK